MRSPQGILSPASYSHTLTGTKGRKETETKFLQIDESVDINLSPPFTSVLYMQFGDLPDSLILVQQDTKQAFTDESFMQEKQSHQADIKIHAAIKMPQI